MDLITYALCRKLIKRSIESLGDIFTLKGNVDSVESLPSTRNNPGDIYLVGPNQNGSYDEYYWTSDGEWEIMGSTIGGLDGVITETTLYKGEDGTGTVEDPAEDTILYIVNNHENIFIEGYYYNNRFWEEESHETEISADPNKIYIDLSTNNIYRYDENSSVYTGIGSFTDTKNTAGATDTSNKIYLVGAEFQTENPQTYSDNEVYVQDGVLNAQEITVGSRQSESTIGQKSSALGDNVIASGNYSVAEGDRTIASGNVSHAEGGVCSSQKYEIALTGEANATTYTTSNTYKLRVGDIIKRYSWQDVYATITEMVTNQSITLDKTLSTSALDNSTCYGYGVTIASGVTSHAEGAGTRASGESCHAEGYWTNASGWGAHAEGANCSASGQGSHAEGFSSISSRAAHAEGSSNYAEGDSSHAEGGDTHSNGWYSHVEGRYSQAYGQAAHAEGYGPVAIGEHSHAEGFNAYEFSAPIICYLTGEANTTTYQFEPYDNSNISSIQIGDVVMAEGFINNLYVGSHLDSQWRKIIAIDIQNSTITLNYPLGIEFGISHKLLYIVHPQPGTAIGHLSHVEGQESKTIGIASHAEGKNTSSEGYYSHAEGFRSIATGNQSHAEGGVAGDFRIVSPWAKNAIIYTISGKVEIGQHVLWEERYLKSGRYYVSPKERTVIDSVYDSTLNASTVTLNESLRSSAMNYSQFVYVFFPGQHIAQGNNSHAEGICTIANGEGQHTEGKFNIADATSLHITGNGTADNARSNAHTLDASGNAWFSGDVYVNSTSGTNKDEGSKKLPADPITNEFIYEITNTVTIHEANIFDPE